MERKGPLSKKRTDKKKIEYAKKDKIKIEIMLIRAITKSFSTYRMAHKPIEEKNTCICVM